MKSRLVNGAVVIIMLGTATTIGTLLTIELYVARWGSPDRHLWEYAMVVAGHLLTCGAYAILSDTVIEDAVKSIVLSVAGGLLISFSPLLGLLAISAAISALVVNQSLQLCLGE